MEWKDILGSIGAKKSDWRLLKPELRDLSEKMKGGNLLSEQDLEKLRENVWLSSEPFGDENGNPFVLYIYDRSWRDVQYKFHFKWCSTLMTMEGIGRRGRYKAKFDIANPLFGSTHETREALDVCLNCLNSFDFSGNRPMVEDFNMKEFFDTHGLQDLKEPTHQHSKHKYSSNWDKISREYKESKDWTCEKCGKDFSDNKKFLQTHHIDGVKDNNSRDNLRALCKECHSEEPLHGNMM